MSTINKKPHSIVEYYSDHSGYKCGYCKSPDTNYSHGMSAYTLAVEDYQNLIDRGWRRSGTYCYKPTMDKTCCPMYTIRCSALEFKLTKSQKKVIKRFNRYLSGDVKQQGDMSSRDRDRKMSASDDSEVDMGGNNECFVESKQKPSDVDISNIKHEKIIHKTDNNVEDAELTGEFSQQPSKVLTANNQCIKKGIDAVIEKGACRKAKQLRLERKMQKLKAKGIETSTLQTKNKNVEKTLEEYLNDLPDEAKNRLQIKLIRTAPAGDEWLQCSTSSHSVYSKYQMKVHNDTEHQCSEKRYRDFLVNSPLKEQYDDDGPECGYGSFQQHYLIDGQLVAVGVIDILPYCVSSVYFYYHPDYMHLTFGTYGALREIAFTRELHRQAPNLRHYYMGFYIHSCIKMRYKGNFHPSELLCPETFAWFPISEAIPKLNVTPYTRLNPDVDAVDTNYFYEKDLSNIPILFKNKVMPYYYYKDRYNIDGDEDELMLEYGRLVGLVTAHCLIVVR